MAYTIRFRDDASVIAIADKFAWAFHIGLWTAQEFRRETEVLRGDELIWDSHNGRSNV